MKLNTIQMAEMTPSSFGMPICGHAFETSFAGTTATTSVVRDRQDAVKAGMGFANDYLPGTDAWRPPPS